MEETSSTRSPLIRSGSGQHGRTNTLAVLIGRATGRRGPSMMVRETAAMQLEERRADWGYSKPVVLLDIIWNLAFVAVSLVMLTSTTAEHPNTPVRIWICGYALQCAIHVVLVWMEFHKRTSRRRFEDGSDGPLDYEVNDSEEEEAESGGFGSSGQSSVGKRCESINTLISFLWWIVGFYWVAAGGETLLQNAPRLYWLAVVFLACDVFFAIFCVALACMIGIALCCCLPCIIAILYAVAGQEGASDADISLLARYRFNHLPLNVTKAAPSGLMVPIANTESGDERVLLLEDAECSICLSPYEDGVELLSLPCNHHFHSKCVSKWLRINATCPLCKYNILKGSEQV